MVYLIRRRKGGSNLGGEEIWKSYTRKPKPTSLPFSSRGARRSKRSARPNVVAFGDALRRKGAYAWSLPLQRLKQTPRKVVRGEQGRLPLPKFIGYTHSRNDVSHAHVYGHTHPMETFIGCSLLYNRCFEDASSFCCWLTFLSSRSGR